VSPSFFKTMRIPLLAGRVFDENDRSGTPWTVVVDDAFAKTHFADQNPIGQVIRFRFEPYKVEEDQPRIIVGVVGQVKFRRRDDRLRPVAYASDLQQPGVFPGGRTSAHLRRRLIVRTRSDPREATAPLVSAVRGIVGDLDRQIPVMTVKSMDFVLTETETSSIYLTRLMIVFGVLAACLAAAGIYAVMSYFVTEHTRDIGIRMALGAKRASVVALVMRRALLLAAGGAVCGIAAAVALTRLIESWLWGITSYDPLTYALVILAIGAVVIASSYLPARRAAALDPMLAIRHD
jgi:putative ABC transport system permease protein